MKGRVPDIWTRKYHDMILTCLLHTHFSIRKDPSLLAIWGKNHLKLFLAFFWYIKPIHFQENSLFVSAGCRYQNFDKCTFCKRHVSYSITIDHLWIGKKCTKSGASLSGMHLQSLESWLYCIGIPYTIPNSFRIVLVFKDTINCEKWAQMVH